MDNRADVSKKNNKIEQVIGIDANDVVYDDKNRDKFSE